MKLSLKLIYFLGLCSLLTACMVVRKPSEAELRALDDPPSAVKMKLDRFYPLALSWYEEVERQLISQGRALSGPEMALAQQLGVKFPEKSGLWFLRNSRCHRIRRWLLRPRSSVWAVR